MQDRTKVTMDDLYEVVYTRFRLVAKAMTFDELKRLLYVRFSSPTTHIWMKVDPYCQRRDVVQLLCRPSFSQCKFMWIFAEIPGVPWSLERRRKMIVGNRIRRFSLLSDARFLYKILDCVSAAGLCAILLPPFLFAIHGRYVAKSCSLH